ncbi:MAG: T9SS type A sorting domain-containing protein [Phycisphaerae bacterium]|nr:T9SS type A sorting domain-containing protein [Saprospiraceae bacterium]
MKNKRFFPLLAAFFCASLFSNLLFAQFENTFGSLVNHEEPQDGKPIPNSNYIVLSNTLSYGPASRILLTRLGSTGSVNMNATIHEPGSPTTAYFGTSIDLDYSTAGAHTGYFIAGSRSTANGRQAVLIRTNTSGTVTWTKVMPNNDVSGTLIESGVSVERQSNGDVIITSNGFNQAANNHRFSVSRFNSAGGQLWSNRYYATLTTQNFEATEACNAVRSGVDVIAVTGRYRATGVANTHTFLSCINATTGVEIWRRSYDAGQNGDQGLDVVYKPANGVAEPAALMVVGSSGPGHPSLWVLRANPLNGIASSKTYAPSVFYSGFSGRAISLDVTGTRAAITGNIIYQPSPGNILSGTFIMVLPFYGTELPDWTYYYSSSSPQFTEPHSIARITGASAGYFVACGSRLTGSAFNDAHTIRVNSLGSNGPTGCDIEQISVIRTLLGTSSSRAFSRTPYSWTNILPARITQNFSQEFCTGLLGGIGEDRTNVIVEEVAAPRLFPNPVSAGQTATLAFDLPEAGKVQVRVFDLAGREVWTFNQVLSEGEQVLELPTSQWAKGAYLVQLQLPALSKTIKLVVSGN